MTETLKLPVLPLADAVVLPGMVVPLSPRQRHPGRGRRGPAAPATRRARRAAPRRRVRRVGTVAVIEQVGRLPSGEPAAVVRGVTRARIGSGVPGPGAALWVEATPCRRARSDRPDPRAGPRVQGPGHRRSCSSAAPGRSIDAVERMTDPAELADSAGYAPWLDAGAEGRAARRGRRGRRGWSCWSAGRASTSPSRRSPRRSARTSARAWRRPSASSCCASSSPRSARSWARTSPTAPATTAPASRRPTCPRRSARRRCARSASWSGPATSRPRPAGSAPGSTPSWSCRGTTRTEDNTDLAAARAVLDADHAGLADVKDRILEYLAVRNRRARTAACRWSAAAAPARCWPWSARPASARRSLGESVARALGRKFVRVVARRRPRRGGDPRPPAHLRRRAARPHRPGDPRGRFDEPGRAARRGRQGRRRTSAATRPRPCSRCSTRRRTTRSATTTSRSTSTCPTCCSWPPPTWWRPSPARCWTGWRWSRSTATPRTRRSPSPATTCCPGSSTGPA